MEQWKNTYLCAAHAKLNVFSGPEKNIRSGIFFTAGGIFCFSFRPNVKRLKWTG